MFLTFIGLELTVMAVVFSNGGHRFLEYLR